VSEVLLSQFKVEDYLEQSRPKKRSVGQQGVASSRYPFWLGSTGETFSELEPKI